MIARLALVYSSTFAVGAALIVAGHHARREPARGRRETWQRYGSYVAITLLVLTAAALHELAFAALLLLAVAASLREILRATGGAVVGGVCAGVALTAATAVSGPAAHPPALAAAAVWLLVRPLAARDLRAALGASAATALPLLYVAFLGSHALTFGSGDSFFGRFAFFYMVVLVSDGFALAVGRLAGRRRLAPRLSPGKTLEGAAGGLAAAALAGLALRAAVPELGAAAAATAALATSAAVQLGDLVASSFKRVAGVKDYGTWLPGFGGVLDRFDGFFLAAPVFAWTLVLLGVR